MYRLREKPIITLTKFVTYVQIVKEHLLETKEVDDVLGGDDAWANVDRTEGTARLSVPKI